MHRFFSLIACVSAVSFVTISCSPNEQTSNTNSSDNADDELVLYSYDHGEILTPDGDKISAKSNGVYLYSNEVNPISGGRTGAAYIVVPKSFETKARGNMVRVTIEAKADNENPSSSFGVAYSTAMAGNSGWQTFTPTLDFKPFSFDYSVSSYAERPANFDYIGINADMIGTGRGIVVRNVQVDLINP